MCWGMATVGGTNGILGAVKRSCSLNNGLGFRMVLEKKTFGTYRRSIAKLNNFVVSVICFANVRKVELWETSIYCEPDNAK